MRLPSLLSPSMPLSSQSMREGSVRRGATAAIVGAALALRLLAVYAFVAHQPISVFFGQATELGCLAASAAAGHGLSDPFGATTGASAFLAPGYPLLVAAVFGVFGAYSSASGLVLMLLQAIFGAATVAVLMGMARRIAGPASAVTAGLLCALCPPLILLTTLFWETTLTVLLFATLIVVAVACALQATGWRWLGLGALAGVALMVNPALLPVVLCCVGWAAWQTSPLGLGLRMAGLACVTCLTLCLPWVVRNEFALHAFIPTRSNLGYELWQGNRAGSDGYFERTLHLNVNAQEFARYAQLGEVGYMGEKGELAKADIRADRGRFLRLTAKRLVNFWEGAGRISARPLVSYLVLSDAMALVGLCGLWWRSSRYAVLLTMLLLLFPVPYYITHPDARFRLVFEPMMLMLATYAMGRLWGRVRHRSEAGALSDALVSMGVRGSEL